jgi:hypothetical protein
MRSSGFVILPTTLVMFKDFFKVDSFTSHGGLVIIWTKGKITIFPVPHESIKRTDPAFLDFCKNLWIKASKPSNTSKNLLKKLLKRRYKICRKAKAALIANKNQFTKNFPFETSFSSSILYKMNKQSDECIKEIIPLIHNFRDWYNLLIHQEGDKSNHFVRIPPNTEPVLEIII